MLKIGQVIYDKSGKVQRGQFAGWTKYYARVLFGGEIRYVLRENVTRVPWQVDGVKYRSCISAG